MKGVCSLLFVSLGFAFCYFGQKVDIKFYTTADGLSSNRLFASDIVQDAQGFLWIDAGRYNRFDAYQFLNYNQNSNPVFEIREASSNLLCRGEDLVFLKNRQLIEFNTRNGKNKIHTLDSLGNLEHLVAPSGSQIFKTPNEEIVIPMLDTIKRIVVLTFFHDGHLKNAFHFLMQRKVLI